MQMSKTQIDLAQSSDLFLVAHASGGVQWWTANPTRGLVTALRYAADRVEAAVADVEEDGPVSGCFVCEESGINCRAHAE